MIVYEIRKFDEENPQIIDEDTPQIIGLQYTARKRDAFVILRRSCKTPGMAYLSRQDWPTTKAAAIDRANRPGTGGIGDTKLIAIATRVGNRVEIERY